MRAAAHTVEASDAEAVEMLLDLDYLTRLQPTVGPPALRITHRVVGRVSLGRASFGMEADLRGRSDDVIGIARARAGRLSYTYAGEEERWSTGDLFVGVDPASDYVLHVEDADVDHTMIDVAVFEQVTEAVPGEQIRLSSHAPVSARAAASWVRAWRLVSDLARDEHLLDTDLVAGQLSRMLAAVTLTTFPNNAVLEPRTQDRRDAHPAAVVRAVSLIEASPDLDLTLVDLARAAHVSPRALQLGFRRCLDTTPMAYLRRVRLDHAREEILAAAPGDGTRITEVAARWGWARPSRFAASYRAAYGRSPSEDREGSGSSGGR